MFNNSQYCNLLNKKKYSYDLLNNSYTEKSKINDKKDKTVAEIDREKLEKKFPKKNEILGPNEVNSGLTFLDVHKNGDIILYRKEELLKVLIHELIHSNLIDEKIIFSGSINEFSKLFCVNYNILLNEAFTESFATIINNAAYKATSYGRPTKASHERINTFKLNLF